MDPVHPRPGQQLEFVLLDVVRDHAVDGERDIELGLPELGELLELRVGDRHEAVVVEADLAQMREAPARVLDLVDDAIERVKQKLLSLGQREVESRRIGEMVMRELYKLDKVAYIRFASVYRAFQDVEDFRDAVKEVQKPAARRKSK